MKKLSILILLIFIGCGSVKKSKESVEIEKEINTKTETELNYELESYSIEPINLNKPILIGSKVVENGKVIYIKEKGKETKEEVKNEKEDIREDKKEVDNTKIYLYLIAGVLIFFLILFILTILYFHFFVRKKSLP